MHIQVEKLDTFSGHRDGVYALAASGDNARFFSAAGDGLVVRWNLQTPDVGELMAQVPASIYALGWDARREYLWIGQNFDGIHVIDVRDKKELAAIKITAAAIFSIVVFDNTALVGLADGTIVVMDAQTFAVRKHIKASEKSVRCIDIHPLGHTFAVAYSDNTIKIFSLEDFSLQKVIEAHQNSVFCIKYSPDYQFLLSGSRDAHLKVWDVANNYALHKDIVAHLFAINDICFSPDGRFFATASMDKSIKIWDSQQFRLLKVIDKARHAGHGTSVNKLWWSSHKGLLVSASDDKRVSVWKIEVKN